MRGGQLVGVEFFAARGLGALGIEARDAVRRARLPCVAMFFFGAGTRRTTEATPAGADIRSRPGASPSPADPNAAPAHRRLPAGRQRGGSQQRSTASLKNRDPWRETWSPPFAAVGSANGAVPCLIWAALTDLDGAVSGRSHAARNCRDVDMPWPRVRHEWHKPPLPGERLGNATRKTATAADPARRSSAADHVCLRAGPAVPRAGGNLSAMDISPSGNAPGSRVYRQAQDVAPAPRFACHDPVTSAQIRTSHPADAIALSDTHGLPAVDTPRPSIDPNAIAVDRYALCRRGRYDGRAGFAETERGDGKCQQKSFFHGGLTIIPGARIHAIVQQTSHRSGFIWSDASQPAQPILL